MTYEEKILNAMRTLGITREEAVEMLAEDERIDHMTSASEIDSDLTEEQKKNAKKSRQATRKPSEGKEPVKRARKENSDKRYLISLLEKTINEVIPVACSVDNPEREINFRFNDVSYKIVLSAPTKNKKA